MAIQVSGTQVISNARALTNIASVDATSAASITAAGVGGVPSISFVPTTAYRSSTFTKPADAYVLTNSFFPNGTNIIRSGFPSSAYEVCVSAALTNSGVMEVFYYLPVPNIHTLRPGNYWGDIVLVGKKNAILNTSVYFFQVSGGWTTKTNWPQDYRKSLFKADAGDVFCIWASDAYSGGADYNSNLSWNANTTYITIENLTLT